jgi:hypothetical protein
MDGPGALMLTFRHSIKSHQRQGHQDFSWQVLLQDFVLAKQTMKKILILTNYPYSRNLKTVACISVGGSLTQIVSLPV